VRKSARSRKPSRQYYGMKGRRPPAAAQPQGSARSRRRGFRPFLCLAIAAVVALRSRGVRGLGITSTTDRLLLSSASVSKRGLAHPHGIVSAISASKPRPMRLRGGDVDAGSAKGGGGGGGGEGLDLWSACFALAFINVITTTQIANMSCAMRALCFQVTPSHPSVSHSFGPLSPSLPLSLSFLPIIPLSLPSSPLTHSPFSIPLPPPLSPTRLPSPHPPSFPPPHPAHSPPPQTSNRIESITRLSRKSTCKIPIAAKGRSART
jgi:hypothetical protein